MSELERMQELLQEAGYYVVKPPEDFHHYLLYYIERRLSLDEWTALDDGIDEVLDRLGLSESTVGFAGPIPEIGGA